MREKISKFLRILKVELEDLEEDINALAEITEERRKDHKITEYVSQENISLLKQEFAGINEVIHDLDRLEPVEGETFQQFVDRLTLHVREVIIASAYPDAVYIFIDRKIQKVADYLREKLV